MTSGPPSGPNAVQGFPPDPGPILDELDRVIEAAYFAPLSLGDALALRLRCPGLKGLALSDVIDVFTLMEDVDIPQGDDGRPDAGRAMGAFLDMLAQRRPDLMDRIRQSDDRLVLEPGLALGAALTMGRRAIMRWREEWAGKGASSLGDDDRSLERILAEILAGFDPDQTPDDSAWRQALRTWLKGLDPLVQPWVYLEAWAEFVRGVLDEPIRPELEKRWPY